MTIKNGYLIENKGKIESLPYTLIGHTSLPASFSITLTGEGIKEISKKIKKGEYLHIEIFNNNPNSTNFRITK
jgi:hypothetical protein